MSKLITAAEARKNAIKIADEVEEGRHLATQYDDSELLFLSAEYEGEIAPPQNAIKAKYKIIAEKSGYIRISTIGAVLLFTAGMIAGAIFFALR